MSIVISSGLRQTVILLSGTSAVAVALGIGWQHVKKFKAIPPLVDLQLSGGLFNGTASSGTLVGAQPGSTFAVGGTPPAGLSIASSGGTYTWTGAGSGTGVYTITETNPAASGSPHVTTIHWSITAAGVPDTTPDAFSFTDVTNAPLSTVETSNAITVSGLGAGVTVSASISGDASSQIQLNGGTWGAGPVTVTNGDTIKVRNTSSSSNSAAVNTTLTIGAVSDTFTSTTSAALALGTLTFSSTAFTSGASTSGTINGATTGSTITASGLPTGLSINGAARTWAWDGTGTAGSGSFTLTETLSGATGSPKVSTVTYTISGVATGTLSAPVLGYPSPLATNPTTVAVSIGNDWQTGDVLKLAYSTAESMTSPTILTHTLTDTDVSGGSVSVGIPTLSGATFFQSFGSHAGTDSQYLSNKVKWGDTTAPTITTSAAQSQMELFPLSVALAANETVTWTITGGADQAQFALSGSNLTWFGNGTQNYTSPADSDTNNTYLVQVTATDLGGNTASLAITVTVTAADKTCDTFTFTDVNGATVGSTYTSNTITISGLTAGISVAATVTGGSYSKNGAAFTAAGSFTVQNGDTIALRVTSAVGTVSSVLNVNGVSDSYDVWDGSITQWQLVVTGTNTAPDRARIAELQMRAAVGGANLCTGGTAFGDGPEFGSSAWVPASAFDGNAATMWSAAPCPVALGYTFATNTPTIAQIAITAPNNSSDAQWAPGAFYLQKKSGGSWTTVQTWTSSTAWSASETRTFLV